MNLVSWVIRSTEGYVLSKPISKKVTHTLYIDDLKGYSDEIKSLERDLTLFHAKVVNEIIEKHAINGLYDSNN